MKWDGGFTRRISLGRKNEIKSGNPKTSLALISFSLKEFPFHRISMIGIGFSPRHEPLSVQLLLSALSALPQFLNSSSLWVPHAVVECACLILVT